MIRMARARSDERQSAIISAAVHVIAAQGLSAPTATIAKQAGVSNGSLFTYFATKTDLLNQIYIDIKTEIGAAACDGLQGDDDLRSQLLHVWRRWLHWGVSYAERRRALAHLSVSDVITPETRRAGHQAMLGVAALLEQGRKNGPFREAPLSFVSALTNAIADTTMDFMISDPANADQHAMTALEGLWRMLT
jgi:AcrR family transcriptional regulator